MRRRLLFLISALLLALPLKAQVQEVLSEFSVGAGGGVNLSKASFSPSVRQKNLMGADFGVIGRYVCERYFGITCGLQLEVNYSQWGWSEAYEDYPELSYEGRNNYISIPFLTHMGFGKPGKPQFFIHLGPEIAFHLSDSFKSGGDWSQASDLVQEQHGKTVENGFSYGISAGAGVEVPVGRHHILLEGRYYYALSDFYKNTKRDYFSRSAHNVLSVRMSYLFGL